MSAVYSSDSRYIVSGGSDSTVRFWEAKSGQPIGEPLRGHSLGIQSVTFSPDGSRVVSGGSDGVRLWPAPKVWVDELCKKLTRNMGRKEWREWVSPELVYKEQCPGLPTPP